MTESEKLLRDIETLRESVQLTELEWVEGLSSQDRESYRTRITLLESELQALLERLWSDDDDDGVRSDI